jgi:hypothetical protein
VHVQKGGPWIARGMHPALGSRRPYDRMLRVAPIGIEVPPE